MAFCGPTSFQNIVIRDSPKNIPYNENKFSFKSSSNSSCASFCRQPPVPMERENSHFGDGYSLHSRHSYGSSNNSVTQQRFMPRGDEPEVDYDDGATDLYRRIENKDWDGALSRLELAPLEAKTWVYRREYDGKKTRWRLLPIHAVCIFRAPLALIEALIEVYPDGPQMKDDQGMLPVHLACRNGASKGVVLTLLSAFPDSIQVRDRKNRLPLDLVDTSNSANKEAVYNAIKRFQKEFVAANGNFAAYSRVDHNSGASQATPIPPTPALNQVQEVDYENRTVLFRLILKKDWKAASARAASNPEEAATWIVTKGFNGNLRFLPLHKACVLQPPEPVISALLTSYPDGSKDKDQDGWLPVHCACFYGANEKVVNALLVANPKGAQTKDDEGRLPLHYACLKGASKAVVDVLLASYSKGAMVKDDEGRLAVHHACSKSAPDSIIEALLKSSPKGAQSKDDQGRLPLHHACRKNATDRTIRTLLRVYPRAAQVKDDQEKLPIHYACQHGAGKDVVSLLLQTYPESVNVQNGFGMTPLAEVKALNPQQNPKAESVIRLLEKVKKEQDKMKLSSGQDAGLETKVDVLQSQLEQLEKTLGRVTVLGKEMKHELKKGKDPSDVLERFSEALIELGAATSSSKMPLKARNSTSPGKGGANAAGGGGKGLFGRARSASAKVIKKSSK